MKVCNSIETISEVIAEVEKAVGCPVEVSTVGVDVQTGIDGNASVGNISVQMRWEPGKRQDRKSNR